MDNTRKFPDTLSATFEDDGEDGFFSANETLEDAVGGTRELVRVATYKLQTVNEATKTVEIVSEVTQ